MSSRRAYEPSKNASVHSRLRKEWIALDGGDVSVWEMTAAQMVQLAERSARPSVDPRGGVDTGAASAWMAALCTHHDDQENSPRVWDDMALAAVFDLRFEEFTKLQQAIQRVNGTAEAEVDGLQDFTGAPEAPKASDSTASASSNSTGSPRRSTSPTTR